MSNSEPRERDVPGSLSAEQWERVASLFEAASDLAPPERERCLADAASEDPRVAATARRMIAADRGGAELLDRGVADAAHLTVPAEAPLPAGAAVGAFDVLGELGRGGMGIVYAAIDRHLGRPAALKFLPVAMAGHAYAAERLLAEAKAASALDHPNVATVYQVGETADGRQFIAMPRYDGRTLRDRLAEGPLPAAEALAIARQVAAGLAAAHRAGIIHRDVSPANIFLTRDGPVKLLDFGIAALGERDAVELAPGGTISSMSPEQARGGPADPRSDVWALGAVLFRMLTGTAPFAGATAQESLSRLRSDAEAASLVGRRAVPRRLARVVERALRRDPDARYPDAAALLRALDAAAYPLVTPRLAGAVAITVIVTAAAVLILESPRSSPPAARPGVTLAVLPAPPMADSSDAYLADGVVDELTGRLVKLRRLRVKGPRAALAAADESSPQAIGGALGVDYILRSGIRRRDTLLEVSLALTDAREGFLLWEGEYVGAVGALQALQDSLARDVASAVAGELSVLERSALAARTTDSPLAFDRYLRGNYLIGKRTPDAVAAAIREYETAASADPRFAEALARSAYGYLLFADWGWTYPGRTRAQLLTNAAALNERAMEIDPTSPETWLSHAYLHVLQDPKRFTGAVRLFQRSLELDSLNAETHHQLGQALMALGRHHEANAAYHRALLLEPARPMTLVPLAAIALQRGDREAARRYADSAVAVTRLVPAPYALAVRASVRLHSGDPEGALDDARRALELDDSYPPPALAVMTVALQRLGDTAAAAAALWRLRTTLDPMRPTPTDARFAASALFAIGETDEALDLIERARPRGALLWYYLASADFARYRDLPRFRSVVEESDPR